MLTNNLKEALREIDNLISLTQSDIEDIKQANHESLFSKAKLKGELINLFEAKKSAVDREILRVVNENNNPNNRLEDILSEDEKDLIEGLKIKLTGLKELNKHYARLVLGVSEFYNSLLEKVLPTEMEGYHKVVKSSNSYLHLKV